MDEGIPLCWAYRANASGMLDTIHNKWGLWDLKVTELAVGNANLDLDALLGDDELE